jgi:hypothetical protein
MPVCPSVRMEQRGNQWTNLHAIWDLSIFVKYIENLQV